MARPIGRRKHGGFTLIEALIAATVLAIGLLGCAAILVRSLQASRLALQRTQAVALAADMAERLRADRAAASSFALAAGTQLAAPLLACDTVDQCDPEQVAAFELHAWQQAVQRVLPDARAAITVAPTAVPAANLYTITILWAQSGDGAAASISLTVQA